MNKKILFNDIYSLLKSNDVIVVTDEKDLLIFMEDDDDLEYTKGFYVKEIIAPSRESITVILYEKEDCK